MVFGQLSWTDQDVMDPLCEENMSLGHSAKHSHIYEHEKFVWIKQT
ncbi:hypothetical protein QE439_004326 [Pedobacter agri]|nr:hypothetical protein [Pedobacter agri]